MTKVKVLNVQFDACTKDEAIARIFEYISSRSHEGAKHIVTPNPEMLLMAQHNKKFHDILNNAWLSIPDGIGILWASTFQHGTQRSSGIMRLLKAATSLLSIVVCPRYIKKVFPERITGVDLMQSICAESRKYGLKIFLLGAAPGIAEKTKEALEIQFRGVKVVGTMSGSPASDDFVAIHARIAETQPDIVFVAFGAPAQELWIAEYMREFKSVKIIMGVGGAFDFITGKRKRAPRWMQRAGTEWAWRLIQEPSRTKRIWNAVVRFPWNVIKQGF